MKLPVLMIFLIATALPAGAERLFMVVGASDASPAGIARKAKSLSQDGLVFRTSDCGDRKNSFAWAAKVETNAQSARSALQSLRGEVPQAYVKRCDVKRGSLLAHRITAVDPSIADVPDSAVNWDEKDMITEIRNLPDERSLVLHRYYQQEPDDPLEGRRERVILLAASHEPEELEKNCIDTANVQSVGDLLAFQCAREQAADHLLHSVVVFRRDGRKIKEIRHCRNPRLNRHYVGCQKEEVRPNGALKLSSIKILLH